MIIAPVSGASVEDVRDELAEVDTASHSDTRGHLFHGHGLRSRNCYRRRVTTNMTNKRGRKTN
jgi:hypothetical protein